MELGRGSEIEARAEDRGLVPRNGGNPLILGQIETSPRYLIKSGFVWEFCIDFLIVRAAGDFLRF